VSHPRIYFLLNPSRPRRLPVLRQAAVLAARRHGWTADFGVIDRSAGARHAVPLPECKRIVVVGGDGSMNHVLRHLHETGRLNDVEVAIVPAGTCNDFARGLKLSPRRIRQAMDVACSGVVKPLDLAEMNGQLFFNNAGFGRKLNPHARRPAGPIKTLRAFESIPLTVRWDKGSIQGSFFMGLVCNSAYFSGGLHFSRSPRTDDGLLDLFLVPTMRKMKLAALVLLGRLGRPLKSRQLVSLRMSEVTLDAGKDLWPQVDGEPTKGATRSLHFRLLAEKARLVCPNR